MKIILRKDVEKLGEAGSMATVKDGYARNYLIPQGLAVAATPGELKMWEHNQAVKAFVEAEKYNGPSLIIAYGHCIAHGIDMAHVMDHEELAVKSGGASGVLGGRAFWKEYFLQDTPESRKRYAEGECVERVKTVDKIVKAQGKPWFVRYGLTPEQLSSVRTAEGWHFRYGGSSRAGGAGARFVEGEVY